MQILKFSFFIFLILFSTFVLAESKPIIVKIGGYDYPPFVEDEGKEGIVKDLIYKLNSSQKKYRFEFVARQSFSGITHINTDVVVFFLNIDGECAFALHSINGIFPKVFYYPAEQ